MALTVGELNVKINLDLKEFNESIKLSEKIVEDFSKSIDSIKDSSNAALSGVGSDFEALQAKITQTKDVVSALKSELDSIKNVDFSGLDLKIQFGSAPDEFFKGVADSFNGFQQSINAVNQSMAESKPTFDSIKAAMDAMVKTIEKLDKKSKTLNSETEETADTTKKASTAVQTVKVDFSQLKTVLEGLDATLKSFNTTVGALEKALGKVNPETLADSIVAAKSIAKANKELAESTNNAAEATKEATKVSRESAQAKRSEESAVTKTRKAKQSEENAEKKAAAAAKKRLGAAVANLVARSDEAKVLGKWTQAIEFAKQARDKFEDPSSTAYIKLNTKLLDLQQESAGKAAQVVSDVATQSSRNIQTENTRLQTLMSAIPQTIREIEALGKEGQDSKIAAEMTRRYEDSIRNLRTAINSSNASYTTKQRAIKKLNELQDQQATIGKRLSKAYYDEQRRLALLEASQGKVVEAAQRMNAAIANQSMIVNANEATIKKNNVALASLSKMQKNAAQAGISTASASGEVLQKLAGSAQSAVAATKKEVNRLLALADKAKAMGDWTSAIEYIAIATGKWNYETTERIKLEAKLKSARDDAALSEIQRADFTTRVGDKFVRLSDKTIRANDKRVKRAIDAADAEIRAIKKLEDAEQVLLKSRDAAKELRNVIKSTPASYEMQAKAAAALDRIESTRVLRQNQLKISLIDIARQQVLAAESQGRFADAIKIGNIELKRASAIVNDQTRPALLRLEKEVNRIRNLRGGLFGGRIMDPRQMGVGLVGGMLGAYDLYDLAQNAGMAITQFVTQSVTAANEIQRISYSSAIVSKDLKTFAEVSEMARDNQRLFGGTLSQNIQELTGFTLVARTAGVDMKSLVSVSQRLAAFDPAQGITGASVALREFLAGNIRSLRERFELPSNILKELGNSALTAQEKIDLLSQFLDSQGLSAANIRGQLSLTQQAYRDFGITWEETSIGAGKATSEFFETAVKNVASAFKVINKTMSNPIGRSDSILGFSGSFSKSLLGGLAYINDAFLDLKFRIQGIDPIKLRSDITNILKNIPEAEIKVQTSIAKLNESGNVDQFKLEIENLKKEAETIKLGNEAFEQIEKLTLSINQNLEKMRNKAAAVGGNMLPQDVNDLKVLEETAALYKESLKVAEESPEAAIAVYKLIQEFKNGKIPAEEFSNAIKRISEASKIASLTTERFSTDIQEFRQKGLEQFTKAFTDFIVYMNILKDLNLEDGLFTQSESGALLNYVTGEIQKVRDADIQKQFIELMNQAADAAIGSLEIPPGVLIALERLTGLAREDLMLLIEGWKLVRLAQNEAATSSFQYSAAALEAEIKTRSLAKNVVIAQNAFKDYQQTGVITDDVMTRLLNLTNENGQKMYANAGAVYAAADAYVELQRVLSGSGEGISRFSEEAIRAEIAQSELEVSNQRATAALEQYAITQSFTSDEMAHMLTLLDENGNKVYENEQAVYDAADAYRDWKRVQEQLGNQTNETNDTVDIATQLAEQFSEKTLRARIESANFSTTQQYAEEILNDVTNGMELNAQKQMFLQTILGDTGTSVSKLISLWEELNLVQTFGMLIQSDSMINQMRRYGATVEQVKQYVKDTYGLDTLVGDLGSGSGGGGGGSTADTLENALEDLKEIIDDYHKDVLEAEKDYQQDLLDIQEKFLEKQKKALVDSEIGKREGRGGFYENLIESDLSQEAKQRFSAQYEEMHATAMKLAQEGKLELSEAYRELVTGNIEANMRLEGKIAQAIADGDTEMADAYRAILQMNKDAQEIAVRELLAGGDPNINERDKATMAANEDLAQSLDGINLRTKERIDAILENEPKIAELLNGTNGEYAEMATFVNDISKYISPLEEGYDRVADSVNTVFGKVKDLITYIKDNPVGVVFTGGIVSGMKSGETEVVESAKGVVDSAVNGAKNEMQASSPSRRTMREIGIPFAQGIVQGIAAYSKAVQSGAVSLVNGAVKAASGVSKNLPVGITKSQENIDAFKQIAETNISILEGLRGLLPDTGGAAQGRASYVAEMAKIDQDTEAQITARREKLSRDVLLARTDDERRILEAIAQQDIALLQQQANIQKASQQQEMSNVTDQEGINAKLSAIQQQAADKLKKLQERMAELAKTNPEEAARIYQLQAQRILDVANLRQELERYLMENNLTADDAYAALLRQQIQQVNALAQMEIRGVNVGNAPINNTVYNINMDLTGSNLRREDVRQIVRQELSKAVSASRGATA